MTRHSEYEVAEQDHFKKVAAKLYLISQKKPTWSNESGDLTQSAIVELEANKFAGIVVMILT